MPEQGYNTNLYIEAKCILEYKHDDDNTETKLTELYEQFVDYCVDFAEARNAQLGIYVDITSEAQEYGEELDDDDLFTTRGRLMTDEDYADLEDEDEEEEEVVLFWVED